MCTLCVAIVLNCLHVCLFIFLFFVLVLGNFKFISKHFNDSVCAVALAPATITMREGVLSILLTL